MAEERGDRIHAAGIVAAGIALVAGSAFVLEQRLSDDDQDFGTLQAPVTRGDEDRAEVARRIRDAVVVIDSDPAAELGGFRGTGRGWVFGNERNDGDSSLLASLSGELGDIGELLAAFGPDDDVLVHPCGDAVGVFVRSSADVADADRSWWEDNECTNVPFWLIGDPGFFVVGVADDT